MIEKVGSMFLDIGGYDKMVIDRPVVVMKISEYVEDSVV